MIRTLAKAVMHRKGDTSIVFFFFLDKSGEACNRVRNDPVPELKETYLLRENRREGARSKTGQG